MIFYGDSLPAPPDNLTIPQFILDTQYPSQPIRQAHHPWLIEDATGRSYGLQEIRARVQGLASSLKTKFDIQEDDVVCLFSPNHIDYGVVIWATHRLGAIITAANPTFGVEELVYQLKTTRAKVIISHPTSRDVAVEAARLSSIPESHIVYLPQTGAAPLEPYLDDLISEGLQSKPSYVERKLNPGEAKTKLAFYSFSSGTTGKPKAVAIPHYALISNVLQMSKFEGVTDPAYQATVPREQQRFRPGDVAIGVLPFFHIYGLVLKLHWILFSAMSIVVIPKFNYENMLKSIVRHKITHLLLVPPQIVLFCKHPATKNYDLSGLRWVMVGAAPLSSELTLQFQKLVPQAEVNQGYGMTETCTTTTMTPLSQRLGTPGSVGHFLPGVRAKIVKSDGSLAGYDQEGELVVTGPQMTLGYANNAQATKETFVDGWVRTGDEVLVRRNGDIFVVDRLKEIFKVRGFQVAPAELEGHLLDHPDVGDAGVIGVPEEFSGEVAMAFIVLNADAQTRVANDKTGHEKERIREAIIKFVKDSKVQYKWLAGGVEFVDIIPKNPSGKILRRFLREQAKELKVQRETKAKL
ncbi:hypothetical protein M422DRAFT_210302 [Sphaerobolus stellatus SS14]|uniref:4-coumarate--CoA ligase n=1 Tax=Sphaerobolus stellatus (strain SS14) TaxID=990650 RepID=A0A0C9VNV4_SPHS4|nr:hypothetical protein M422DRAFT_210302 [Sphaerobolus stellatus SS14]